MVRSPKDRDIKDSLPYVHREHQATIDVEKIQQYDQHIGMKRTKISQLQQHEHQWFQEESLAQIEVSLLTKRLYGITHQEEKLVDNLGPKFQSIQNASFQEKLTTLVHLNAPIITIQLLLQDWHSTQDQLAKLAPVTIQASTTQEPPTQSLV